MGYRYIDTTTWADSEFRSLDRDGKILFLYFLTSPMSNAAGFYKVPLDMIVHDLKDKEEKYEDFEEKIKAVLRKRNKLYEYDLKTEQVFIPNFLKYNAARSVSQIKGMATGLRSISYCPLFVRWAYVAHKYGAEDVLKYLHPSAKRYLKVRSKMMLDTPEGIIVYDIVKDFEEDE